MTALSDISPTFFATLILLSATGFVLVWSLDAITHKKLARIDITDKELQLHQNILLASVLMELSLVSMYWWTWESLPFFISFFVMRTVLEFIDELHFHTERCTPYESRLHLGMWIFVFIKTSTMFLWGFFEHYKGIHDLPVIYFTWAGIVLISMFVVSFFEWRRGLR